MRNAISKIDGSKVGLYRRSEDTTEGRINEQVIGQEKISRMKYKGTKSLKY